MNRFRNIQLTVSIFIDSHSQNVMKIMKGKKIYTINSFIRINDTNTIQLVISFLFLWITTKKIIKFQTERRTELGDCGVEEAADDSDYCNVALASCVVFGDQNKKENTITMKQQKKRSMNELMIND